MPRRGIFLRLPAHGRPDFVARDRKLLYPGHCAFLGRGLQRRLNRLLICPHFPPPLVENSPLTGVVFHIFHRVFNNEPAKRGYTSRNSAELYEAAFSSVQKSPWNFESNCERQGRFAARAAAGESTALCRSPQAGSFPRKRAAGCRGVPAAAFCKIGRRAPAHTESPGNFYPAPSCPLFCWGSSGG